MGRLCPDVLHSLLKLDLYEAGWTDSGDYPGIPHRQVAMNSLANSFVKKFHNEETDDIRDNAALSLFLECNEKCRVFGTIQPKDLKSELVLGELKSILYDFFNPDFCTPKKFERRKEFIYREPHLLNLSDIASCFGLGNGSNIGTTSTDFYSKFVCSTMAHTNPSLPYLFRQAISVDRLWSDLENSRNASSSYELVRGSRLSFVPKSRIISRTICTEPLLNMLFQKGIGGVIERRLDEVFHINLSKQPVLNSSMAHEGSVSGRYGTIDLSSASDSIALSMLEQIMPPEPLNWLKRCRSTSTTLPGGQDIELHMVSSMGNGYTFPLQTCIFACLVSAAYRVSGIPLRYPRGQYAGNFAVFGDDIIVDERVYSTVVDCLELLGFSVNRDKSFNKGLFRESCGSDFYSGYNVRGVYLKKLLTAGDFYSAINRLNYWSASHGILLSRTVGCLKSGCRFIGVPFDEADDSGIKIPESLLRIVRRDINGAIKYMANVNTPRMVRIPSVESSMELDLMGDSYEARVLLPNFRYDPDGLLFCFLAGWIRGGSKHTNSVGLRSLRPRAVLRRKVSPGWDRLISVRGESSGFGSRWKMAVEANLYC